MSGNRLRLAATVSAALQLALSFGLAANLVFCTAASGHVAVESAYSADCCDDHVLPEGARRLSGGDGCGCVDTPILESPVAGRQRLDNVPSPQTLLLPAFLTPHLAGVPSKSGTAPTLRSFAPEWVLTVRRSVVLLV